MEIKAIEYEFTICKVRDLANIDFDDEFFFIGRTEKKTRSYAEQIVFRTMWSKGKTAGERSGSRTNWIFLL